MESDPFDTAGNYLLIFLKDIVYSLTKIFSFNALYLWLFWKKYGNGQVCW